MNLTRRFLLATMVFVLSAGAALAAGTATFTADDSGTFGGTFKYDGKTRVLTVDLSGLPKGATIFRAELYLSGTDRFDRPNTAPTSVYPVGQENKSNGPLSGKLAFVAPRNVSLDALDAVKAAVAAGKPLELKIDNVVKGVTHLEVSTLEGKPRKADIPTVSNLKVTHRAGQSMIVFTEPKLAEFPDFKTGGEVGQFRVQLLKDHPGIDFRIWRSGEKITPQTIAKAALVGQCEPMTAWNNDYHQDGTAKAAPIRYRVIDGGEEVPWGTGLYAHNPDKAGKAFYAVTVSVNGEESFDTLGAGSATDQAVEEAVGPGVPILQWVEMVPKGKESMYRNGPLVRLIYTRWESWPHSSTPNNPIDYLVAMGLDPKPENVGGENAWKGCWRVEPAPVGLHLHCWGGSLNGGYGWWHNGEQGAILIASNQIPYDWWTGYHESRGTRKTFGDGFVRPFSMDRTLGILDWAKDQHKDAHETVRPYWRKLDLTRVFTAGSSMGGAGAPMYPIRYPDRVAWCVAWVGVHVPELSPGFKGSYEGSYGPRDPKITMPDGKTSPWDYFSDVRWLQEHPQQETGFIMASNGKDDGGIGWPQAYQFARALQETRRPHIFNWAHSGHGTRTVYGSTVPLDPRTDKSLPAFTNGSLDDDLGSGKVYTKEEREKIREELLARLKAEDKEPPKNLPIPAADGSMSGALNAHLLWKTDDVVDQADKWEMTVILKADAPKDTCKVDLTPRRCQAFKTPKGATFKYTVAGPDGKELCSGAATGDDLNLLTLKQITLAKGDNRVKIAAR